MINIEFAKLLTEMADMLEMKGDNPFRIRAFRRASEIVESHPQDLSTLSREDTLKIPGIGKGIADMIDEYKAKGHVADHAKLKSKFPDGVLQMMRLQNVGPKRAAQLFKELRIDSIKKVGGACGVWTQTSRKHHE